MVNKIKNNMEKTSFKDFLETDFTSTLLNVLKPIVPVHLRELVKIENANIDYYEFGTDKEKYLKNVMKYFGSLDTIAEDLDFLISFLEFNQRKSITGLFPPLEKQESYYKYHFENYVIRIASIPDICSKLFNATFEQNVKEKYCNWHTFLDRDVKNEQSIIILNQMSNKIEKIRNQRDKKLHMGEIRSTYFDNITFGDEYSKIINTETDPILDKVTDEKISEVVEKIKKEINEVFLLLQQFLNGLLVQLNTKI